MFGPNTHFSRPVEINFSHRDTKFKELYSEVISLFKEKFNLNNYEILFIPGSGTIGCEAVISSLNKAIFFPDSSGKFNSRWKSISKKYGKFSNSDQGISMGCRLETSLSSLSHEIYTIEDSISSFPYYDIHPDAEVFVTCINKQLGGFVGLSVIGIKSDFFENFSETNNYSYLDIKMYRDYAKQSWTPTTAPVHNFMYLRDILLNFDLTSFREKVSQVSKLLVETLGEKNIVGDTSGPVITINKSLIDDSLNDKWRLYGSNNDDTSLFQIFTYSCAIKKYEEFCLDYLKQINM